MKTSILVVEANTHDTAKNVANLAFGCLLQSYRFNKYFVDKSKDKNIVVNEINFISKKAKDCQKTFEELNILDRKSTRLNSSHTDISRMPSSA